MYTLFQPGTLLQGLGLRHGPETSVANKNGQASRDGILSPIARFARRPVSALGNLVQEIRSYSFEDTLHQKEVEERICLLRLALRSAMTLTDWQAAAIELDELEGHNEWKSQDTSTEYNFELIKSRLEELEEARISCDASRMIFLIRTSLSRHLGGMGSLHLYTHSHIGTKRLIERYNSSALETLSSLLEITRRPQTNVEPRVVLEQILAARQAYGRSALLLSGGGTFGMSHIGVVKCLWEARLLPRIVSGASAGSIVCAVLCTRKDDEIPGILKEFCYGDLEVFTKTGEDDNSLAQVARFLKTGAFFDISNLIRVMKNLLGDMTFQEAYNRTRRILNICVSSAGLFELPRLLNYVTAPNVIIWSAVAASCSVPVIFSPADIMAKDPRTGNAVHWTPSSQRWIDGSVDNDLPMTRLSEMFNVNHFIVSQVNPHVTPFLAKEDSVGPSHRTQSNTAGESGPGWMSVLAGLAKDEAMHRMSVLSELGIFPNLLTKTRSILSQRYSGDITILPEVSLAQLPRVLQNPNTEFMLQATVHGERATWPKLSRIQNHVAVELALDDAVHSLRSRIAFSPSQVNLRLNVIQRPTSRAGSDRGHTKHGSLKNLRFSSEHDSITFPSTQQSDTLSPSASEQFIDLSRTVSEPASRLIAVKTRSNDGKRPNNGESKVKPSESPPMFSTASDNDDDTDEDTSSSTTPLQYDSSDEEADYFARPSEISKSKRLFPHSSQPSTPYYAGKRSYFGTSSPVLSTAIAPLANLSMTPTSQRIINRGEGHSRALHSSHNSTASLAADGEVFKAFNASGTGRGRPSSRDSAQIARYHEALERKLKSSPALKSLNVP